VEGTVIKQPTSLFMAVFIAGSLCLVPSGANSQAQPNSPGEAFPFAIGNKWYYQHTISQSSWGILTQIVFETTREIIDTTADRTRIVQVLNLSDQTIGSEQWLCTTDSLLYISSWGLVYNPVDAHDTISLFGNQSPSMTTRHGYQNPLDWFNQSVSVALGIGIYNLSAGEGHSGRINDDTEKLVGMSLGGVVFGDTLVAPSSVDREPELPLRAGLYQNFPNPFNPSTTIRYGLPNRSHVMLTLSNTLGQSVSTLVNGEQEAGYHEVKFDGSRLSSGVYFYKIEAGSFVQTRKLSLIR
jgi:hypothetical protein